MRLYATLLVSLPIVFGVAACCCPCGPMLQQGGPPIQVNVPPVVVQNDANQINKVKKDRRKPAVNVENIVATGKVIFERNERLAETDPPDPTADGCHMKVYSVSMVQGKTYVITLNSAEFRTYACKSSYSGTSIRCCPVSM